MKQILFVDDEPRILSGLERALRAQRHVWGMRFVCGGTEALTKLKECPADVVVTDFRMPGMDGAALLQQIRVLHPEAVRIILSGQFDNEAGLRALPVTHQFLHKPCDPSVIVASIERACRLGDLISNQVVKNVSGSLGLLPPNPEVYLRLSAAIGDDRVNLESIAHIIEQDMAITVKVLQLANSAFFGMPQKVDSIAAAIRSVGFDLLRQMVLVSEIFDQPGSQNLARGFSRPQLQRHSLLSAQIARDVLAPPELAYAASVAALMHDTGRLVLAQARSELYECVLETHGAGKSTLSEAERELLSTTHEEVGAFIAGLWGFPDEQVHAILGHHRPFNWEAAPADVVDGEGKVHDIGLIVALADALAGEPNAELRTPVVEAHWQRWSEQAQRLTTAAENEKEEPQPCER